MSLGGSADDQAMLGLTSMKVPAKRVIPVILKIIEIFKSEKKPGETLNTWIRKIVLGQGSSTIKSLHDIKEKLTPLTTIPELEKDSDFYVDYGNDGGFHAKTGKGECAA